MTDRRRANTNWTICTAEHTGSVSFEAAQLSVLMDLRDEMQAQTRSLDSLVSIMQCHNTRRGFIAMHKLRRHLELLFPAKVRKRKSKANLATIRRRKKQ